MTLDPIQLRVLGALIEKEITTPENYPLSLNALIAACNQRSSRDPVLDLTEDEVRQAVHSLEDIDVVSPVRDARVPKYEHRIRTVLNLRRDETALLCLLLLRGPQTPGELRGRADRMYSFDDIAAVQSTLERLASRAPAASAGLEPTPNTDASTPLVLMLPRQPGSRESRYAHLLGGPVAAAPAAQVRPLPVSGNAAYAAAPPEMDLDQIEARMAAAIEASLDARFAVRLQALEAAIEALKRRLDAPEARQLGAATPPT